MILIDTNILIDYLKGTDSILTDLFEKEELALCGIVLAELLHGVNSNHDKQLIHNAIKDFKWISIEDNIWNSVGNNLNQLRKNGLNIPFQDAILATLCIENNIKIATNDKHFKKIAAILTDLQIYN
jgi:predicted nucleic acid-binding protein